MKLPSETSILGPMQFLKKGKKESSKEGCNLF